MRSLRVMLDTSSVRNLEHDATLIKRLATLHKRKSVTFVICRTVSEELWAGQRLGRGPGIPVIPVTYVGNTVGRVGVMACGDSIGRGESYDAHMVGATSARREKDALIADAARWHADLLVCDDKKCVRRFRQAVPSHPVVGLNELATWLASAGIDEA